MTQRVARVRELMKHELASLLQKEIDFGGALVTVNDIDLTPDLKQAHVYVGIMGREDLVENAFHKLRKRSQELTQALSRRVILKNTPKLFFKLDHSVERGVRVTRLMEEVDRLTPPGSPSYSEDEDYDMDDEADDSK